MWKGSQDTPNNKKGFDIKVWHILKTRTVGLAVELCPDCVQHLECWKLPARSTWTDRVAVEDSVLARSTVVGGEGGR